MKIKQRCLLLLSVFIVIVFTNAIEVNAVHTGFKTSGLSTKEKNTFIFNSNILLIDEEPVKKAITCFDVNSNQLIAIGQNTPDRKIICVYSNEGVFQYGYTFNCSGDFGVEWDEENLNIYFVRSSVIVSVTPNGEILDAFKVPDTIENNSYVNHFIHSTKKTLDNTEYSIENNMGILNLLASSYSQIIIKGPSDAERVIYDVRATQLSNMIVSIVVVGVFVSIVVAGVVWQFIKVRHGN